MQNNPISVNNSVFLLNGGLPTYKNRNAFLTVQFSTI